MQLIAGPHYRALAGGQGMVECYSRDDIVAMLHLLNIAAVDRSSTLPHRSSGTLQVAKQSRLSPQIAHELCSISASPNVNYLHLHLQGQPHKCCMHQTCISILGMLPRGASWQGV